MNKSGFPFQLAVEHLVRVSENQHDWAVVATEFPWEDGFVDLVLRRGPMLIIGECKRATEEKWIFLVPPGSRDDVQRSRLEWWNGRAPEPPALEATIFHTRLFCDDFFVLPASAESEYCVVPKGKSAVPSLEAVCSVLLSAVHEIGDLPGVEHRADFEALVPVIITNAQLVTAHLSPGEEQLTSGEIDDADFRFHKFMRFRKSLVVRRSNDYDDSLMTLESWKADRVRTVFVVQARHLVEFLSAFNNLRFDDMFRTPPAYRHARALGLQ